MYLKELELKNIKCFKSLHLKFDEEFKSPQWTMILGNNSSGKTTLLKSIALGLQAEGSSSFLNKIKPIVRFKKHNDLIQQENILTPVLKEMIKNKQINLDSTMGLISTYLTTNNRIDSLIIHTSFVEEKIYKTIDNNDKFYDDLFLCSYGANRNLSGSIKYDSFDQYWLYDSSKSLFENDSKLLDLSYYLLYLKSSKDNNYDLFINTLENIFWPDQDNYLNPREKDNKLFYINPGMKGLEIITPNGLTIPFKEYGDGYKFLSTMVLDLLGWALLKDNFPKTKDLKGIVLIDELEQHLHPLWQRKIVKTLRCIFPKIQFITTTHSPLVAAGMADIENGKIIHLQNGCEPQIYDGDKFKGLRADQILTSYAFGLETTRNTDVEEKIDELDSLILKEHLNKKHLDKDELEKKIALSEELKKIPNENAETRKLQKEQKEIKKLIKKLNKINDQSEFLKDLYIWKNNLLKNKDLLNLFSETNHLNKLKKFNSIDIFILKHFTYTKSIPQEFYCHLISNKYKDFVFSLKKDDKWNSFNLILKGIPDDQD